MLYYLLGGILIISTMSGCAPVPNVYEYPAEGLPAQKAAIQRPENVQKPENVDKPDNVNKQKPENQDSPEDE